MNKYLILLLVLLLFAIPVAASEGFVDNKCYDEWTFCGDGTTEESQFYWQCGWYVAAYEAGVGAFIPATCQSLVDSMQSQTSNSGGGGSQMSYASGSSSGQAGGGSSSAQPGGGSSSTPTGGGSSSTPTGDGSSSTPTGGENPSGQTGGGQYELITSGSFAGMWRLIDGTCVD